MSDQLDFAREKPVLAPGVHNNLMYVRRLRVVQLEVCGEFPPVADRDEVALSGDAVELSQRREPKYCKWSKQKLMSITGRTCLTQSDTG